MRAYGSSRAFATLENPLTALTPVAVYHYATLYQMLLARKKIFSLGGECVLLTCMMN